MASQVSLTKALGIEAELRSFADMLGSYIEGTLTLREFTQPIRGGCNPITCERICTMMQAES